jgi:hypothetical protein
MNMAKKLTGGGYGSRSVVKSTKSKQEPKSKAVSVPAVAQQGMAVQFKKPALEQGPGYTTKPQGSTGIAGARQGHSGVGPGGGSRVIYRSGSQSPTPPAHGMPEGRQILSEYGPEATGKK